MFSNSVFTRTFINPTKSLAYLHHSNISCLHHSIFSEWNVYGKYFTLCITKSRLDRSFSL